MQSEADCLSPEAQKLAEARLAAKRAARAEAREIRMKELERQQKEIYQVQKKYYGLDTKWGDIEQWMEDSERYSRKSRRNASASDEDERMSVGSRGSLRSDLEYASAYPVAGLENEWTKKKNNSKATNGYDEDMYGSSQNRKSSRASYYSDLGLPSSGFTSKSQPSCQNGSRPSLLYSDVLPARSYRASLYDESIYSGSRRYSASSSRAPSEYSCYLGSGSRTSSRASSARASPVIEERPEKDFEKGARTVSSLSAATLASLGGTSSRRGSGDTSISVDTEASIREIKEINELKDQIQDVEGKYMQGLKEMKDSLAEVEEKYKKAMVSNAQLDNEKTNFMYQVDTLKDALLELEEQLAESKRQYEEKSKEFERERHAHSVLQFQFTEMKEALKQREEMLAALERQKEFFDSIRSERDGLRVEVVMLKEQLKKHGIIPDSEVATNGETSDAFDNEGHSDSSKINQGTTQVLNTSGDGTLGRTNEVEMKNEILENVGKKEILQNTEHEQHKEESEEQEIVKEYTEIKTLHTDENTEREKATEDTDVTSTVILMNSGLEEQTECYREHVLGNVSSSENSDAGSSIEIQQPISLESEHGSDLNERTNQNLEMGTLQSQDIKASQAGCCNLERQEFEGIAQQQKEKQGEFITSQKEGSEATQEVLDLVASSHALVSDQSELPEIVIIGSAIEGPCVEAQVERQDQAEESPKNEVMSDEGEECIDRKIDNVESGREEEENKTDTVQNLESQEIKSVEEEEEVSCDTEVVPDNIAKEQKVDETPALSLLSENDLLLAGEEQSMVSAAENGMNMKQRPGQQEVLVGKLDSDSENKEVQLERSVESIDCITEVKESESHKTEQDQGPMNKEQPQESIIDPSHSDEKIQGAEDTEVWYESQEFEDNSTEQVEGKNTQVEVQTLEYSEDIICGTIIDNVLESKMQGVAKQEAAAAQESPENISVIIEVKNGMEENSKKPGPADQQLETFPSASTNNVLQEATKQSQQHTEEVGGNIKEMEEQNTRSDDMCESISEETDKNWEGQGSEEDKNNRTEQQNEMQEIIPEAEGESSCLNRQESQLDKKLKGQVNEVEGQEEGVEDKGETFIFQSNQELETSERKDAEKVDAQKLEDVKAKEIVTEPIKTGEGGKEEAHQGSVYKTEKEGLLTEDNADIQEKGEESEESNASRSETAKKTCDVVEDKTKVLDTDNTEKITSNPLLDKELESLGTTSVESKEDITGIKRGKGKSKEDCIIS
ncbi:leucine-rich repeat flightless-interacting protein 1 isoform X8 [Alligator sinensis]|uniref:Leucine-rich repeat flightless-interacting protein 1 isoform X8 n=1 Tax=Alligator sinensis TaxID=38654 RepID=A0A3Q0HCE9_ALLSI|nr:leucine-rich repeat flightless-interacting protein 1 isoform X8 [Alligator sinensis]